MRYKITGSILCAIFLASGLSISVPTFAQAGMMAPGEPPTGGPEGPHGPPPGGPEGPHGPPPGEFSGSGEHEATDSAFLPDDSACDLPGHEYDRGQ